MARHCEERSDEAIQGDTRGPNTVRPDQLASETLEFLNAMKRTVLFVVEGTRPVGIVHMHDLLRAGVA